MVLGLETFGGIGLPDWATTEWIATTMICCRVIELSISILLYSHTIDDPMDYPASMTLGREPTRFPVNHQSNHRHLVSTSQHE